MGELTPAMKQYMDVKNSHPDCIVLFRMGDFYETFFEDAKTLSKAVDITLTKRGKNKDGAAIPLAGIPYHALENYLGKLVKKGYKVAICEQLEDPKKAKGVVKRGIVRIVTPGTVIENSLLDDKKNNYIVCICPYGLFSDKDNKQNNAVFGRQSRGCEEKQHGKPIEEQSRNYGFSVVDISTGAFFLSEIPEKSIVDEIAKYSPAEIIIPMSYENSCLRKQLDDYNINTQSDRHYVLEQAKKTLMEHFGVESLFGLGIEGKNAAISAAGSLLSYLNQTQMNALEYISRLSYYNNSDTMQLDRVTIRNLELTESISGRGRTLLLL